LLHADVFRLHLSYNDLAATGIKYIHTQHPLEDSGGVSFTLLYNEEDAMIYAVSYE